MYLAGELSYKLLGWYRHYSVMSTSLLVSSGAVSCYPASMVNLIGFANVYRVSTKQHGDMKSGVLRPKNATILQAWCASTMSCLNM